MIVSHTDLKPGDRFRLTQRENQAVDEGLVQYSIYEGTVSRVEGDKVFYETGGRDYYLLDIEGSTWERIAQAEPKNLGAVVAFTDDDRTVQVVRYDATDADATFVEDNGRAYSWNDILRIDASPRVLHSGFAE